MTRAARTPLPAQALGLTVEAFLCGRLDGRWVCRACGAVDDWVVTFRRYPARGATAACACGARAAALDPPGDALVPFGRERGVPLAEASGSTLDWLHGLDRLHPWTRRAVCDALGCHCPDEPGAP